jgi:hypothetical protein
VRAAESLDPDPRDLALMRGYPSIPWLTGLPVHVNRDTGIACRLCAARYGLDARNVSALPQSEAELREHLRSFHHLEP